MRILGRTINYFRVPMIFSGLLFTFGWIVCILVCSQALRGICGRAVYGVCFVLFWFMAVANALYFSLTDYMISFQLLTMADEGSAYILDVITGASPSLYVVALVLLVVGIYAIWKQPLTEAFRPKLLVGAIVGFILMQLVTPLFLGKANNALEWDTWRNPRNVYADFNDSNKNMKICGLYQYTFRDFVCYFFANEEEENPEELAFLEEVYAHLETAEANAKTGVFAGKNLIFLQLEGMDEWLLNENDTPTLYAMKKQSMVSTEHYSYYTGGGSTFNSEFAVNTGFVTPISFTKNAYTFSDNCYDYSLANLFRANGYRVNAFHMNTKEYYNRGINYERWGYDHYFSLLDSAEYGDVSYELDRELFENELFYEELFRKEQPFCHYIITYTPHTPFSLDSKLGTLLSEKYYPDGNVPELEEEACARLFAKETDYAVELLLKGLKDNGLYENTVIVAFADHYLYTLNDKSILQEQKPVEGNLINRTPFFIWSADGEAETITKVNSQLDILPTVLNLFGIDYYPDCYVGRDIFDETYSGYVFFSDYSWYDGVSYAENGEVVFGERLDEEQMSLRNQEIHRLIQKNDWTLKYDYLRRIKK